MTDLAPYERIAQRAEWLATSQDWDAAHAEYADLLQQLQRLGPPADAHARTRIWSRFEAARRTFIEAHAAAVAAAPRDGDPTGAATPPGTGSGARPGASELLSAAFRGYPRALAMRAADSRARFWPFPLIGVPVGAGVIAVSFAAAFSLPRVATFGAFLIPLFGLVAVWWLLSVHSAVRRRLNDAGADPWLSLAVLYIPIAVALSLGFVPIIYAPNADARGSVGMSIAAAIVTILFVGNAVVHLLSRVRSRPGEYCGGVTGPAH